MKPRIFAFALTLLGGYSSLAQPQDVDIGESDEETEIVEVEEDGFLDDTAGTVDVATTDHRSEFTFDLRTAYLDDETDFRDGNGSSLETLRVRWRAQGVYQVTEKIRLGGRVAGICSDIECEPNFLTDSSIPTQNGISDGDIAIDTLFLHRFRSERYDVAIGRLQTKFVARGGIFSKSLDRNDSNNTRVNWTDGAHLTFRAMNGWVSHAILQHNSASGSGSVRRAPLDFSDRGSRISYYYGIESLEPRRNLLQRGFGITYLPKSLMADGMPNGRLDNYWTLVARASGRWPRRSEGIRLRFSAELGYAPNTQTRQAAQLGGTGDVDGQAWNVTLSLMDFRPSHSIGINYGRTDPGWLLSPQYGDNEELHEIRYSWRPGRDFAIDFRVRQRRDLKQLVSTQEKLERFEYLVRFSWAFSSNS